MNPRQITHTHLSWADVDPHFPNAGVEWDIYNESHPKELSYLKILPYGYRGGIKLHAITAEGEIYVYDGPSKHDTRLFRINGTWGRPDRTSWHQLSFGRLSRFSVD